MFLNLTSRGSNADLKNKVARDYSRYAHPLGVLCNWQFNSTSLQRTGGPSRDESGLHNLGRARTEYG